MTTNRFREIARACSLRFGEGSRSRMEDFFSVGDGLYLVAEGKNAFTAYVRGNGSARAVSMIEAAQRGNGYARVSRSYGGYVVYVKNAARMMPVGGRPFRPTPPTPSANYLYFEAKQANSTVSIMSTLATAPNLEYSTDGSTFQEWNSTQQDMGGGMMIWVFDTITLGNVGDKVYLKGINAAMSDIVNQKMSVFMPTGNVKVGGSVQSLVDGTGESTTAIEMFSLFFDQMSSGALTEVESGLLPATTLADRCYMAMFQSCSALTTAPVLPATTLVDYCYEAMFAGCTSLTEITCLATDISATDCTLDWVNGVAASGTFTKAAAMSGWTEGASGIPSGWTVADYSE